MNNINDIFNKILDDFCLFNGYTKMQPDIKVELELVKQEGSNKLYDVYITSFNSRIKLDINVYETIDAIWYGNNDFQSKCYNFGWEIKNEIKRNITNLLMNKS